MSKNSENYKQSHLGYYFFEQMKLRDPDEICLIDGATGEEETVGSLIKRSIQVARCFRRLGLRPGNVLALAGLNHVHLRIPYYAALMTGLPVAGVDPLFKRHEIKWLLSLTKAKIAFCENEIQETYRQVAEELGIDLIIVTFGEGNQSLQKFIKENDDDEALDEFKPTDFDLNSTYAWLVSTSGSTGLPKLAAFKHHQNLIDASIQWLQLQGVTKDNGKQKKLLLISPAQWISGFLSSYGAMVCGACVVQTSTPNDIGHLIDVINKYKPNGVLSSPTLHALIMDHEKKCNYDCFDVINVGGTKVHNDIVQRLRALVRTDAMVRESYGQTEAGGFVFASNRGTPVGSCGTVQLHWFYVVKLVDLDTGDEIKEPFKAGELWYRGHHFDAYFKKPEETAEMFEEGWLKSGDLFQFDDEGNYYFVERLKMMIKYRNFAIVPPELEEVILTHPGVQEVAVTRVPHPTDGQHPVACVVRRPGAEVTAQEIKDLIANNLTETKQLRGGVIFMEELPKTSTGKVARKVLEEIVLNSHRE